MSKKILKTEQGRSMVEMLGVLAVMGLLTIIGIAGFKMAMNKHYANQTVDRLMRRAVVVAGQANFGQNLSLHEFNENDGEYPISRTLKSTSESFTMRVDNVPQEVCQQIVGMEWKLAKIIPENCSDETMEFMFLNDLTDCTNCQPDTFPCEDYGKECGKCSVVKGFFANEGNSCTNPEKQYCVLGNCESCPPGQTMYNNTCKACSTITDLNMSTFADYCHQCINDQNQPTHFLRGEPPTICNRCTDLGDSFYSRTSLAECNRCANRCFHPRTKQCGIPGKVGGRGTDFTPYVRGNDGYCDCADGYFWRYHNSKDKLFCTTCSGLTTSSWTTVEDCHSCVNAQNQPTHFMRSSGNIHLCEICTDTQDSSAGPNTSIEECRRCSNRCLLNGKCGVAGVANRYIDLTNYKRGDDGYCIYVGE